MLFLSKYNELILQVTPDKTTVINGQVVYDIGKIVEFSRGQYTTEDAAMIDLIKDTQAFKNGDVVAVEDTDLQAETKKKSR